MWNVYEANNDMIFAWTLIIQKTPEWEKFLNFKIQLIKYSFFLLPFSRACVGACEDLGDFRSVLNQKVIQTLNFAGKTKKQQKKVNYGKFIHSVFDVVVLLWKRRKGILDGILYFTAAMLNIWWKTSKTYLKFGWKFARNSLESRSWQFQ